MNELAISDPKAQALIKDDPRDRWGQGVVWIVGTGRHAICFVQKTPVMTWADLDAWQRLGQHFAMVGGDSE